MSPASRSKSKDKKAGKELPKISSKPSGHVNTSGGIPASGYNPLLGTFHTFEAAPVPSTSPLHANGCFQNIDDPDDTVSNNDSWSGESEDHKEKTSQSTARQDSVPRADNDKREKIRQKNEKKHQRQKERRAQELHERCTGYLMSRKLEALAHRLVAMGFSQERATMALVINEGRVEESVSWLFESSEEDNKHREHNLDARRNLKIDISKELARMSQLETQYKASKQEVERAVVASEGDLDKAEKSLKEHKQEPPAVPPKPEETGDPPTVVVTGKLPIPLTLDPNTMKVLTESIPPTIMQEKTDGNFFYYTKAPVTVVGPSVDHGTKNMQALRKIPPKPHHILSTDKRWTSAGSNPSVSYSLAPPLQASPPLAKMEPRFSGNELRTLQLGSVREPVTVMQRPQSINSNQVPSSSPPIWYSSSNVENVKPNKFASLSVSTSRSTGVSLNPMYNQLHYQSQQQQFVSSSSSSMGSQVGCSNGLWSGGGASPTLAPATSLGLFCGLGTNGSPGSNSPVDWNTGGSTLQLDYASIDWSLDLGSLTSKANGWWTNSSYSMQNSNAHTFDSFAYGLGVKSAMRPGLLNRNGGSISGLHDEVASSEAADGGSREWRSAFEEKDIFSLPRQFVSSPSL